MGRSLGLDSALSSAKECEKVYPTRYAVTNVALDPDS
jgi:hypothetical protein